MIISPISSDMFILLITLSGSFSLGFSSLYFRSGSAYSFGFVLSIGFLSRLSTGSSTGFLGGLEWVLACTFGTTVSTGLSFDKMLLIGFPSRPISSPFGPLITRVRNSKDNFDKNFCNHHVILFNVQCDIHFHWPI